MPDPTYGSATVTLLPVGQGALTIPDPIKFQCAPLEEFAFQSQTEHTDYLTVNGGEYSRLYGRKLRTASFETLVTTADESWGAAAVNPYTNVPFSASDFATTLQTLCDEGKVFRLTVTKPTFTGANGESPLILGMDATLRTLKVTEKSGEPDTKYLALDFFEYRSPVLTEESRSSRREPQPHTLAMQYDKKKKRWTVRIVAPKDSPARKRIADMVKKKKVTLAKIAQAIYGKDGRTKTKTILDANPELGKKWGKDTALEKNKWFSSGKKRVFNVPKEPS